MDPFELRTERLVLNQPRPTDIDAMAMYCADPVFEQFMSTPWPYERHHAEWFVTTGVPDGWRTDAEWNWAIRHSAEGPLLGVIGIRLFNDMIGYWLGAEHRGQKIMSEAVSATTAAFFARTEREQVLWECVTGNIASLRIAQAAGFTYTGEAPGIVLGRSGERKQSWTGQLNREHAMPETAQPWPA